MKEAEGKGWGAAMQLKSSGSGSTTSAGGGSGSSSSSKRRRTAEENKEKTKLRERQRRYITTKIFRGLRKHGGYSLSPRADINEVLQQLANEARWIVEPDGTTYRCPTTTSTAFNAGNNNVCPTCGAGGRRSGTPTPTSSIIAGGGEYSTTASTRPVTVADSASGFGIPAPVYYPGGIEVGSGGGVSSWSQGIEINYPFAMNVYRGLSGVIRPTSTAAVAPYQQQQQMYLMEARASNQNTPVVSPQRRR